MRKSGVAMQRIAQMDEEAGLQLYWQRETVARLNEGLAYQSRAEIEAAWRSLEPILRSDYIYEARG